jgi:SAM-dependent methyltransferase
MKLHHKSTGHGHSAKYLDKNKVTKYVALEPNPFMHDIIRQKALAAGFEPHQIQVIGCGAEHVSEISRKLDGVQVDCIISILTLCGISDVKKTVNDLVTTILKPKGIFIFYEHGQCDTNPTIAWWQSFWTPIWQLILGCRLDTPTPEILKGLDLWENTQTWQKKGETPGLFCHRLGCFTKRDNL